jgi:putative inorganic carbon (HCO3(-)) transporter
MRTIAVIILVTLFFLLSLKSRIAALNTYWWFAVFRPHEWAYADLSSLRLPLVAAVLLVVPSIFYKHVPKFNHPLALMMLLLCLFSALANFVNGCAGTGYVVKTLTTSEMFIILYVVLLSSDLIRTKEHFFLLVLVIALSFGFHSGKSGIFALLTGANYYNAKQLGGFASGSNAYALSTGMILFFMILTFQFIDSKELVGERKKWFYRLLKFLFFVIVFGSFYNIMALQSRGSFLATVLALFVWIWLHPKRKKYLLTTFLSISLVLAVVPLPEGYKDRIQSAFAEKEERDSSAAARPFFWNIAFEIAKSYPLGTGPGCYPVYFNYFDTSGGLYGYYRSVHGSHAQILSDSGFIGILIWISMIFYSFKRLFSIRALAKERIPKSDTYKFYFFSANAMIGLLIVFYVGGTFYESAYHDIPWLVWGLIIALDRLIKEKMGSDSVDAKR